MNKTGSQVIKTNTSYSLISQTQDSMQILTSKTGLSRYSGSWIKRTLEDYGECIRGVSYNGTMDLYSSDCEQSIKLLRSNNVQNSKLNLGVCAAETSGHDLAFVIGGQL